MRVKTKMKDPTYAIAVLLLCIAGMLQPSQQQSIDELIASSYQETSGFDLIFDVDGNTFLTEMDMVLTKVQKEALDTLGEMDDPNSHALSRKKRKAVKALNYRWRSNTIPYKIASNVFSSSQRNQIMLAIQEWKTYTCLNFREATSSDNNRIYFNNGGGCYSYVGMTGGSQTIGLAPGCRVKGVVVHEIGHAVGFHHEQNRPDRDDYVRIIKQNIPSNIYYNFKKYPWSAVTSHGVGYDYGSIMHYGGTAFSKNGQYTIRTINPADQGKIGNRRGLSFSDIKLANLMYSCGNKCGNKKCTGLGYVGKDCNCWCPGNPIKKCDGTEVTTRRGSTHPTRSTTTATVTCKDMNKHCSSWARAGYCGRNSYVRTYCKKSCKTCSGTSTGKSVCKDLNQYCGHWSNKGYCKGKYAGFMSENCAKTCKACTPLTNPDGSGGTTKFCSSLVVMATSFVMAFIGHFLS